MSNESITDVIVAIDPSLSNTAIVLGSTDDPDISCESSKPCGNCVEDRIVRYANQVYNIIEYIRWATELSRVRAVFIEGYSFNSRIGGEHLGEYGGLLRKALLNEVCEKVYEVTPATLKKFATGKGSGPKDLVAAHITKRYGVLLSSNDEYDAYGLYRLGLVAVGWEEAANQAQREAVDTVLGLNVKPKKKRAKKMEVNDE